MPDQNIHLIRLIITTTAIILLLAGFIITLLYLYQEKQLDQQKDMEEIKSVHEKQILQTQLEIQEQTLQEVSRDIHDNIALGLTLSKLNLNTLNYQDGSRFQDKIELSVNLIGEAIRNLNNISKSLNADLLKQYGLHNAIENEIGNLEKTGKFRIEYNITGAPVFLESKTELVIFRILQEALNNIIKHSYATRIAVILDYDATRLDMSITDNGRGFSFNEINSAARRSAGSGLNNIQQRARTIGSECRIVSKVGEGTMIRIITPLSADEEKNY